MQRSLSRRFIAVMCEGVISAVDVADVFKRRMMFKEVSFRSASDILCCSLQSPYTVFVVFF